jgi:hypothetical protein
MALAAKKQPQRTLAADIERLRSDLISFFEERVATLKQSRDGANLPIEALRHQLTRGDTCLCRVIRRLLDE